jgi:hypothetical protein
VTLADARDYTDAAVIRALSGCGTEDDDGVLAEERAWRRALRPHWSDDDIDEWIAQELLV